MSLLRASRQSIETQREESMYLLRIQDEERRRIARELHDSTGQELAMLTINLGSLRLKTERVNHEVAKLAGDCELLAKQISTELRTISYLLHPPLLDEMGLTSALNCFAAGFRNKSKIKVILDLPDNLGTLPRDLETAIFRIVQESLTNIHRHSGSSSAAISLQQQAGHILLEIRDEGKGIPGEVLSNVERGCSSGVGLRGMRERVKNLGGELKISSVGKGTQIRVIIPLASSQHARS